jgi:hypothetical protein
MMKCKRKECNGQELVHLGGTVGGVQLYGCPKCYLVYYWEPRMEYEHEAAKEARNRQAAEPMLAPAG